jgi:biotin operon repressor
MKKEKTKEEQQLPDTFTPCFDEMLKVLGPTKTVIWGKIHRLAYKLGYSYMSNQTLADELQIDERTIGKYIQEFVDSDLLIEAHPTNPPKVDGRIKFYIPNIPIYEAIFIKKSEDSEGEALDIEAIQQIYAETNKKYEKVNRIHADFNSIDVKVNRIHAKKKHMNVKVNRIHAETSSKKVLLIEKDNTEINTETTKEINKEIIKPNRNASVSICEPIIDDLNFSGDLPESIKLTQKLISGEVNIDEWGSIEPEIEFQN